MGCVLRGIVEAPAVAILAKSTRVMTIPTTAKQGVMELKNISGGGQVVKCRLGSPMISPDNYTVILEDGEAWSLDGLVPGEVVAVCATGDGIITGAAYFVP